MSKIITNVKKTITNLTDPKPLNGSVCVYKGFILHFYQIDADIVRKKVHSHQGP